MLNKKESEIMNISGNNNNIPENIIGKTFKIDENGDLTEVKEEDSENNNIEKDGIGAIFDFAKKHTGSSEILGTPYIGFNIEF